MCATSHTMNTAVVSRHGTCRRILSCLTTVSTVSWNEYIARHHYLGCKTPVGAQMRYAVHDRRGSPLAVLGFSTAAWRLASRDTFIRWIHAGTTEGRGRYDRYKNPINPKRTSG